MGPTGVISEHLIVQTESVSEGSETPTSEPQSFNYMDFSSLCNITRSW